MGKVDVFVEIDIAAAPADVAAVMFDPEQEPQWMKAVTDVEIVDRALKPGARVRHRGNFMGREIAWMTEVESVHFPHVLTLRIDEGPFVGTVRYDIQRTEMGSRVRIRNTGEPTVVSFLPESMVAPPMRAALKADLLRLKALVENDS